MKDVEVSVVMAEYNTNKDDLCTAIESILTQSYKNFEFIIVDDCGKNNLDEILKKYDDDRIKLIKNPRNMGFVYSLNNGIKNSKGKYIVRMDTDDISDKFRIEKLYNFIINNPEYSVVGTKALEFSGDKKYGVLGKSGEKKAKNILHGDIIIHASAIMEKKAIETIGYYKDYKRAEDFVLWCELLLHGYRLYTIDECLYYYRVNKQDYSKRKLKYRHDEIKSKFIYFKKLNAGIFDYFYIFKSIISGILPIALVQKFRNSFKLK